MHVSALAETILAPEPAAIRPAATPAKPQAAAEPAGDAHHRERFRRAAVRGAAAAAVYLAVSLAAFGAWVHYFYAGHYGGPLNISMLFGISDASLEAGARPIYDKGIGGWDGQFYYTQSNDLFIREHYVDGHLIDNVSYRYTRNGLPMMAKAASLLAGQSLTTPLAYHLTQFLFTAAGFGLLVAWLVYHNHSWMWALLWGLYGGVLRPLLHGLPDPTADALFLACILAALGGRLWLYCAAATVLCLCRESYAAPAAVLWGLTVANKFPWKSSANYYARVAATALPGAAILVWVFYVAYQLDLPVLHGSRSLPWGALVDWPFKAYLQCSWQDWTLATPHNNPKDILEATCAAVCLLAVMAVVVRKAWSSSWGAVHLTPLLPHLLLMSMTGFIIWEGSTGYLKNVSSVVLLGVVLLPSTQSRILRVSLLSVFAVGLYSTYKWEWRELGFLPPLETVDADPGTLTVAAVPPPARYGSSLELVSREENPDGYNGLYQRWHRSRGSVTVRIKNTSSDPWPMTRPGAQAITIGLKRFEGRGVIEERLPLREPVPAGGSIDVRIPVSVHGDGRTPHEMRIAMVHDGRRWFNEGDASQELVVRY